MKESFWGYFLITMGLLVIVVMYLVQDLTSTSEEDFYLTKEVMQAAMLDSIDFGVYRKYGDVRIISEKFVENFTRRFSQSMSSIKTYTFEFYEIYEFPPKATVRVSTSTGKFKVTTDSAVDFDIITAISGILEGKDLKTDNNFEKINIKVINGEISSEEKYIVPGVENTFFITPFFGYKLEEATFTCSNKSTIILSEEKKTCTSGETVWINGEAINILDAKPNNTYTVNLAKIKNSITVYMQNGKLTTPKTVYVNDGESAKFTFTSNPGYTVENAGIECVHGSKYKFSGNSVTITPADLNEECTVYLRESKQKLTIAAVNATIDGETTRIVDYNGSSVVEVYPNSGYTTDGMTVSCTGGAKYSISDNNVTISGINLSQTCTITAKAMTDTTQLAYKKVHSRYDIRIVRYYATNTNTNMMFISDFSTTYSDGGYTTVLRVEGSDVNYNSDINGGMIENKGVTLSMQGTNINNKTVEVRYTITNNGSTSATYGVASHADSELGSNDSITLTRVGKTQIYTAYYSNYKIYLNFVDPVTYSYVGDYIGRFQYLWTNGRANISIGDSGLAFSWTGTIKPGETIVKRMRYVLECSNSAC